MHWRYPFSLKAITTHAIRTANESPQSTDSYRSLICQISIIWLRRYRRTAEFAFHRFSFLVCSNSLLLFAYRACSFKAKKITENCRYRKWVHIPVPSINASWYINTIWAIFRIRTLNFQTATFPVNNFAIFCINTYLHDTWVPALSPIPIIFDNKLQIEVNTRCCGDLYFDKLVIHRERCPNINSNEIISGIIRIHESHSAINQEFKFRLIQTSLVHPN